MPRQCLEKDCTSQPNFGYPKDDKATYCSPHGKLLGMVDITHPKCKFNTCGKTPNFGLSTDKKATYCNKHKLDNMINIVTPKCIFDKCNTVPIFGIPGNKKATYCNDHKLIDMIDIKHPKCKFDACLSRANFGLPTDKKPTYCSPHASDNMIDIIHPKCIFENCSTNPNFGLPIDKCATYCQSHALKGMININASECIEPNCITNPKFGYPTDKNATYCASHALKGMVDITNKRCKTCITTVINSKYKPNCARCHFYLHPDDTRIINYKTKEQAYMTALLKKFPQFILDKIIKGGCSKRRPDGFLDLLTHVIIVEIDENEHKSYDDTCNNRRTMELSEDVDYRPIVFIRLNPDGYTLDGKRMKGSFSLTKKNNELKVVKKEFNKRLNSLIESVEKYMITIPDKTISVEYLYFTE